VREEGAPPPPPLMARWFSESRPRVRAPRGGSPPNPRQFRRVPHNLARLYAARCLASELSRFRRREEPRRGRGLIHLFPGFLRAARAPLIIHERDVIPLRSPLVTENTPPALPLPAIRTAIRDNDGAVDLGGKIPGRIVSATRIRVDVTDDSRGPPRVRVVASTFRNRAEGLRANDSVRRVAGPRDPR